MINNFNTVNFVCFTLLAKQPNTNVARGHDKINPAVGPAKIENPPLPPSTGNPAANYALITIPLTDNLYKYSHLQKK